jgi:hypothetical protein
LISPKEARATPKTMIRTLNNTLSFGLETPKIQEVIRTATGATAWGVSVVVKEGKLSLKDWGGDTYFEHLDECYTQI